MNIDYRLHDHSASISHIDYEEVKQGIFTIYLGGHLEGLEYTYMHFPQLVLDERLFAYNRVSDFIEDNIEYTLAHEFIHLLLYRLCGEGCSEMWDNADRNLRLTLR